MSLLMLNAAIKGKSKTRPTFVSLYEHTIVPATRARATLWQGDFYYSSLHMDPSIVTIHHAAF
jgi:hypothetical protein